MKQKIQYGTTTIEYDLSFANRKSLGISVHPDGQVAVVAPLEAETKQIQAKLKSKAAWIIKQQDFFIGFHPLTPPRKYIAGETHLYLGKQYRLKLEASPAESVKLIGGYIIVKVKDTTNKTRIKKLLHTWYQNKAHIHFEQLFTQWIKHYEEEGEKKASLEYRWMTKRWGTCHYSGQITLNYELIKAPKACIEYVIVHEICHLTHLNHSRDFYQLLEKYLPNWKAIKHRLEHFLV